MLRHGPRMNQSGMVRSYSTTLSLLADYTDHRKVLSLTNIFIRPRSDAHIQYKEQKQLNKNHDSLKSNFFMSHHSRYRQMLLSKTSTVYYFNNIDMLTDNLTYSKHLNI